MEKKTERGKRKGGRKKERREGGREIREGDR